MLGGADNPNGELLSYIIGADTGRGGTHSTYQKQCWQRDHRGESGWSSYRLLVVDCRGYYAFLKASSWPWPVGEPGDFIFTQVPAGTSFQAFP